MKKNVVAARRAVAELARRPARPEPEPRDGAARAPS